MVTKERIEKVFSAKKRTCIMRLYLEGISYDEISRKANVTKSIVGHVVLKFRKGQYPEFAGLSEQVGILRKLALKLRKVRLEPQ